MSAEDIEASKAPLMDHLIELRQRMIYALIGVGIGFVVCFAFAGDIYKTPTPSPTVQRCSSRLPCFSSSG